MGTADLVPGVSGGTVALLLGIYQELLYSVKTLTTPSFWRLLFTRRFRSALRLGNLTFLVALVVGILVALVGLARVFEFLLEDYPVYIWSFFFGLVLGSIYTVGRRNPKWRPLTIGIAVVTALALASFLLLSSLLGWGWTETPNDAWFIFVSGAISICALMLPGISGSLILVLLGKYEYIITALNQRDLATLGFFVLGALTGIAAFSHLLSLLLRRWYATTLAVMVGLLAGSLPALWPWRSDEGQQLPQTVGLELLFAVALMLGSAALVLSLEQMARRRTGKSEQ